jgi:aminoglycoside phosphotransferase (APT) family kinase protein
MDGQGLGKGPIGDVQRLAGGSQNILISFTRDARTYVLRRPPQALRANSNETMRREARVLGALAGSDVPHPALIAACDDTSVLGAAFYLMEPVDGFNAVGGLPARHAGDPAIRRRMGLALAEAAARIGNLDHVRAGLADFGRSEGFLERQVARWSSQLAGYAELEGWPGPAALAGVEDIGRWLEDRRPRRFEPGLMHGDFHIANVLYRHDSGEVAAVVDWELATIGAPLLDLGWLLATWPGPDGEWTVKVEPWEGFPTAEELAAAYGRASGHDLADLPWWRVLACYKLAIIIEGSFARACAGLAPMDVGQTLHARAVRLIRRAANWISE